MLRLRAQSLIEYAVLLAAVVGIVTAAALLLSGAVTDIISGFVANM